MITPPIKIVKILCAPVDEWYVEKLGEELGVIEFEDKWTPVIDWLQQAYLSKELQASMNFSMRFIHKDDVEVIGAGRLRNMMEDYSPLSLLNDMEVIDKFDIKPQFGLRGSLSELPRWAGTSDELAEWHKINLGTGLPIGFKF